MEVNNNLGGMLTAEMKVNEMAQNLAEVANITGDHVHQENTQDFINSIVGQIPEVVAYQVNAQGIITEQKVFDSILNIKA